MLEAKRFAPAQGRLRVPPGLFRMDRAVAAR